MRDSQSSEMGSGRNPQVWGSRIPNRNRNFTGREELLVALHDALNSRKQDDGVVTAVVSDAQKHYTPTSEPQALQGMGGVGKTQVAIEYAHRYQQEYELVWWVSADQPKLVAAALAGLAEPLGLVATSTGIAETAQTVLEMLRKGDPYRRWLLIYDNADRPEDIANLIPSGEGHVLITSRNQAWRNRFSAIAVEVFSRVESIAFLTRRVPDAITEVDASRLADALGDLPLALDQASALLNETGMSVDDYLQALKDQPSETLAENHPTEYPIPMTRAWQLSVGQLEKQLPVAVNLLRACAFFGPEPIPVDVFRRRARATIPHLGEILGNTILRARTLRTLGRFALAHIDSKARTIQVHRLIQALLRETVDEQTAIEFRGSVHLLLAAAAPANPDENEQWDRFEELVPHVEPARVSESTHRDVREFARKIVRYLYQAGDYDLALSFADQFLERWRGLAGSEVDALLMEALRAQILREQGAYAEAYETDKNVIERAEATSGMDQKDILPIINSFGADLRARGEFQRALEHDKDSVERHSAVFGEDDARTLRAINNLALDYGLNSRYVRARELHDHALNAMSEATVGITRTDVLRAWFNLSRVVRLCGDYLEARDVGRDAYDFGRKYVRPEHLAMLRAGTDLSIALRRAGESEEALNLAREIHERHMRLYGADSPDTLAAAMSLANVLRTTGNIGEAYEKAEDSVRRYPRIYGEHHPYNYGCIGNLALLSRVSGRLREARALNEQALQGLRERLGDDHHYTLTIATNLASDCYEMGDAERARQLGEDTLGKLRTLLGEDHPMTLGCASNLTVDLWELGVDEKAERLFDDTIARYDRTLGPKHPDTVVARLAPEKRRLDFDFDPPPI